MTQNEIMLGDWLCLTTNHQPQKIVNVEQLENNVTIIGLVDKDGDYDALYLNELEPIKLTKEILEKNGWKKCKGEDEFHVKYQCDYEDLIVEWRNIFTTIPGLFGYFSCTNPYTLSEIINGLPLNYVHELQHALRLCGIEKEIIL